MSLLTCTETACETKNEMDLCSALSTDRDEE